MAAKKARILIEQDSGPGGAYEVSAPPGYYLKDMGEGGHIALWDRDELDYAKDMARQGMARCGCPDCKPIWEARAVAAVAKRRFSARSLWGKK